MKTFKSSSTQITSEAGYEKLDDLFLRYPRDKFVMDKPQLSQFTLDLAIVSKLYEHVVELTNLLSF